MRQFFLLIYVLVAFSFLYSMEQQDVQLAIEVSKKDRDILFGYIEKSWENFFRRKLDSEKIPVDMRNVAGNTLLLEACAWCRPKIVSILLERGANVHASSEAVSTTALHTAIRSGPDAYSIVEQLLVYGADPSCRFWGSLTPLHNAASGGYVLLVILLLTRSRCNIDYTVTQDDDINEVVTLFTDFRVMEGKKLLTVKDQNKLTALGRVKIDLTSLSRKPDLKPHEVERKKGFGELIPLLTVELFETNFRAAIENDVKKILASSKK